MEGLKKGVPTQKSPNMIQKLNEDLSEFLERVYQAYQKHTDADLQAPENVSMVNMTSIGQSTPKYQKEAPMLLTGHWE